MPRLGSTITRLVDGQLNWTRAMRLASASPDAAASASPLARVADFGPNPGALDMFVHVPERLAPNPGLVVVLHGCTQDAAGYDRGAGWSALAERHGFVAVFPQQRPANNPKLCFDWFQPDDIRRGSGEAASIRHMVERAILDHGIDRSRVFVTGLSAGGAMTAVMLATYPDVFAGGAVIAGLPYGGARNVQDALGSMFQGRSHPAAEWGDLVRVASPHRGPWPILSIWHGSADAVVTPGNADELATQWTNLHGLSLDDGRRDTLDGQQRRVWRDAAGRVVVESITVAGMGHGTPLAVGPGEGRGGTAGPFMLDVGISSSHHIARFWGLSDTVTAPSLGAAPGAAASAIPPRAADPVPAEPRDPAAGSAGPFGIAATIDNALKRAGLLRR